MDNSSDNQPQLLTKTETLAAEILNVLKDQHQAHNQHRKIVAIAGPPGSGKSTLMSELLPLLQNKLGNEAVTGIPMDGFHLDNVQLDLDDNRGVKGAPHTFDIDGLLSLVERISDSTHLDASRPIYAPEFDRSNDASRNCVLKIDHEHKLVLIEGNYLLLDKPIWRELKKHFSLTINIDVSADTLKERLVNRWLHYGLSEKDALSKALSNDIPNAQTVIEQSMAADILFKPEKI